MAVKPTLGRMVSAEQVANVANGVHPILDLRHW